ncbi:hypothetical protein [Paenibacillus alkalitolerans]|uniref:hypothetical protein n=1 Tax=Paenibacillus alkalitolerans TaxID=2799335 RepID=UPI0018F28D73|nr:hypothetical protein [Paenibacillus alkalitolerans]
MNERIKEIEDKLHDGDYDCYFTSALGNDVCDKSASQAIEYLLSTITSLLAENDKYREALKEVQLASKDDTLPDFYLLARTVNNIAQSALREEQE